MKIKSNGSITPNPFSIQQFNNNVDIKCFEIPRFYYGNTDSETDISELYDTNPVDLSKCSVVMRLSNPDDKINQGINLFISNDKGEDEFSDDDDKVIVNWIITNNVSDYAGKRTYQLEFYDGDVLAFRTQVMNFVVKESLDTESLIPIHQPTIFEEFEDKLNDIMNDTTNYTDFIVKEVTEQTNEVATSINNKVDNEISAIETKVNSVASGSPKGVYTDSAAIKTANPETGVYIATGNGHIYSWTKNQSEDPVDLGVYQSTGIGENSVGFIELNNELKEYIKIDTPTYTLTNGIYIRKSDLTDTTHALFSETSPIELKKGQTICFKGQGYNTNVSMITVCDSTGSNRSQGVISVDSTTREYKYTALKDCYVIISSKTSELSGICIINNLISKEDLPENLSTVCSYIDSYNLPEPTILENKYVLLSNGTVATYNGINATDYIEVLPLSIKISCVANLTTIPKGIGVCFYDKYKNFISSSEYTRDSKVSIIEMPSNTKYIKYTESQNMINYGYNIEYTSFKDFVNYIKEYVTEMTETNEEKYSSQLFTSFIKFGVIGDSLASGEAIANNGGSNQYIDNYDYSWGQFIARNHGMSCVNFSKGGATTRSWLNPANEWGINKLLQSENLCNAYIIGLGVNDPGLGNDYLGTINDMYTDYTQNADTFYGNYGKIIGNIKTIAPKAKIFIFTVPKDWGEYNTAIRNIANHYNENVYLIDLYNLFNNEYYGNDTFITNNRRVGHYNAIGYNYMSELLFRELNKFMYENYEEFKQLEFINTEYSYTE